MAVAFRLAMLACAAFVALAAAASRPTAAVALRPMLAVRHVQDVDAVVSDATGLRFHVVESIVRRRIVSTDTPYGFKISAVDEPSAAAGAGLRRGDVLLQWDGQPITSRADLAKWIGAAEAAAPIVITYARLKANRRLLDRHPWVMHEATITLAR